MSETQTQKLPEEMTADERRQILGTALQAMNASLVVFQQFGILGDTETITVPGITTPVATPQPEQPLGTLDGECSPPAAPLPERGPGGRFLPRAGSPAKPRKKPVAAYKPPTAPNIVADFVKWFLQAEERDLYGVKRGQWECTEGEHAFVLKFYSAATRSGDKESGRHIVAVRQKGGLVPIFNASRIRYGSSWAAQQNPQRLAEEYGAVPVPIENVINPAEGAGLDPAKLEVLDWTGAEKMVIPPVNYAYGSNNFNVQLRHFAGAVVLKIDDHHFLFDTDREELKHHNFNPFFTELPEPVANVAEAYEKLAPAEVHAALAAGKRTVRQGEFFFVEADDQEVIGEFTDDFDKRTLEILVARADALGAAVINHMHGARLASARDFVKKYPRTRPDKDMHGVAHESWIEDIESATRVELERLAIPVGPKEAWLERSGNQPARTPATHIGEGHTSTHLDHYREELVVRLHEQHGGDRRFGILFAQVLEKLDPNDKRPEWQRRGNGHLVTLMRKKGDATYVRGAVLHRGREHRPVFLDGWYRVYSNTAFHNWTVHGDVD